MVRKFTSIILLSIALSGAVLSQEAVDQSVKAAEYELGRVEQQLAGAKQNQAAKLKRIERMLESAAAQLQKSANQQDASWIATNRKLEALNASLAELTEPATADPAAASRLSDVDAGILDALNRHTDSLIRQINEYDSADFVRLQSSLLQRIEGLKQEYRQLSQPENVQAIVIAQKVLATEKRIHDQISAFAAQQEKLGDVEGRIASMLQRIDQANRPGQSSTFPSVPYTRNAVME